MREVLKPRVIGGTSSGRNENREVYQLPASLRSEITTRVPQITNNLLPPWLACKPRGGRPCRRWELNPQGLSRRADRGT